MSKASAHRPHAIAQFHRLRRQVPPMYFMVAVSAATLAYTHLQVAPAWLCIYVPLALIALSLMRLAQWLVPVTPDQITHAYAGSMLRRTEIFAGLLSIGFIVWALLLDQYGGPYEHGHVAVFVGISVMGCIFCLTNLPRAAHTVCAIVLGPFLIYCVVRGVAAQVAMAINILVVGLIVLKVLHDSYAAFLALEESREAFEIERAQAQHLSEENARLAHSDPLTTLPNRRYFFARLDSMLARAQEDTTFCIGVIDLDRFKAVNDTLGHAQGDRLLQIVGDRLRALAGPNVTIARLGGDELGLIVEGDMESAARVGQQVCDAIHRPVHLGDAAVSIGCSGGLAAFPEAGSTAHDLFDRADFALYHAKKQHRGTCVRFSGELEKLIRSEQALEAALQTADLTHELAVAYQPVISTRSMQMVGLEALARWTSPTLGPIPAEMLFTTAERLGLARKVTLTLFARILEQVRSLPHSVHVSFNLAPTDIADPETVDGLLAAMARTGVRAERLVFEITETSLIHDAHVARAALERLRASGARIALDDFGTGYSSLSSLHELPIDILKIDRSFATRLDDPVGRRLISAIRNLARTLSLACVFEGIETEMQLMEATLAGFDFVQGYLLAKPDSLEAILAMQEQRRTAAA